MIAECSALQAPLYPLSMYVIEVSDPLSVRAPLIQRSIRPILQNRAPVVSDEMASKLSGGLNILWE
jgi:hypothetical protein